jgi:hypothetical protein
MITAYLLLMLVLPLIAMAVRTMAFAALDGKIRTPLWNCVVDQLKAVGLYALLGPPFGVLPLVVVSAFQKEELHNLWIVIPAMLMSHAFGALPAMVTGAVVGALKPWLGRWRALAVGGAAGAVHTILWLAAASLTEKWENVAIFAAAGAFAGVVCAWIMFRAPAKRGADQGRPPAMA